MILTAEEIAMCRDALLEAGVPTGVIDKLLWTEGRLRKIGAIRVIDEHAYSIGAIRVIEHAHSFGLPESAIASMKRELYAKVVWHLIEEGIAEVKQARVPGGVEFRLDMTVLTPPDWKPPAKVQR